MKIQTARKKHLCGLCEGEIAIGERYWRDTVFTDDGRIDLDHKEHVSCPEKPITARERIDV